jgi:uncharacterized RmlC-like cupin family protein
MTHSADGQYSAEAPPLYLIQERGDFMSTFNAAEIVTVRPTATIMTRQELPNFVGISGATAGAKHLSMNLVVIPPGGTAQPHVHHGHETAIYLLRGRVETRYGPGLQQSVINEAGDFIFIPADVPHQPVNLSATEPAHALVARDDANEQESVVAYDPAAAS